MYVETIHIEAANKNINDQKERHKLHALLDEALDLMTRKDNSR